jgi:hypothetical protein
MTAMAPVHGGVSHHLDSTAPESDSTTHTTLGVVRPPKGTIVSGECDVRPRSLDREGGSCGATTHGRAVADRAPPPDVQSSAPGARP